MSDRPKCRATTKKGKPCRAYALAGRETCLAHADAETRESVGFVADNGKGGRKPLPKPTDVARRLVEQHVEVTLAPHFATLGYRVERDEAGELSIVADESLGARIYGESKDGDIRMTDHADLGAQITAAEKLLDRIYGRPKQATEVTGADGAPLIPDQELAPNDADTHTAASLVVLEAQAATAAAAATNGKASGTH